MPTTMTKAIFWGPTWTNRYTHPLNTHSLSIRTLSRNTFSIHTLSRHPLFCCIASQYALVRHALSKHSLHPYFQCTPYLLFWHASLHDTLAILTLQKNLKWPFPNTLYYIPFLTPFTAPPTDRHPQHQHQQNRWSRCMVWWVWIELICYYRQRIYQHRQYCVSIVAYLHRSYCRSFSGE